MTSLDLTLNACNFVNNSESEFSNITRKASSCDTSGINEIHLLKAGAEFRTNVDYSLNMPHRGESALKDSAANENLILALDVETSSIKQNKTDSFLPQIITISNNLRKVLAGSSKYNTEQKIHQIILQYISEVKSNFDEICKCSVTCRKLARHLTRTLDLVDSICNAFSDTHEYIYRLSEIISFYISCEIVLARGISEKTPISNRIACVMKRYLQVPFEEEITKSNMLRTFILMPSTFKDPDIIIPLYRHFIPQSIIIVQKELPDKLYIQYLIIFYSWMTYESTDENKEKVIGLAQQFMRPSKTLCMNSNYAYHLPKYASRVTATRYIMENLKFFNDIRNASIFDNSLKNMQGIIDFSENDPILESREHVPLPLLSIDTSKTFHKFDINKSIKLEEPTVIESVDLTNQEDFEVNVELFFLPNLIKKAKDMKSMHLWLEKLQLKNKNSDIIVLDSDSESETEVADRNRKNQSKQSNVELFSLDFDNDSKSSNTQGNCGNYDSDWSDIDKTSEEANLDRRVEEDPVDPTKLVCNFNKKFSRTYGKDSRKKCNVASNEAQLVEPSSPNTSNQQSYSVLNIDIDNDNTKTPVKMPRILEAFSCRRNSLHIKSSPPFFPNNNENLNDTELQKNDLSYQTSAELSSSQKFELGGSIYTKYIEETHKFEEDYNSFPSDFVESSAPQRKQVQFNDVIVGPSTSNSKNPHVFPMKSSLISSHRRSCTSPLNNGLPNLIPRRHSLNYLQQNNRSSSTSSPISDILKESLRREQLNAIPKIFSNFAPFKSLKKLPANHKNSSDNKIIPSILKATEETTKLRKKSIEKKPYKTTRQKRSILKSPEKSKSKATTDLTKCSDKVVPGAKESSKTNTKIDSTATSKALKLKETTDPKLFKMQCSVIIKNDQNEAQFMSKLLESQNQSLRRNKIPNRIYQLVNEVRHKSVILDKIDTHIKHKSSESDFQDTMEKLLEPPGSSVKSNRVKLKSKKQKGGENVNVSVELNKFRKPNEILKETLEKLEQFTKDNSIISLNESEATYKDVVKIPHNEITKESPTDTSFESNKSPLLLRRVKVRVKREKLKKSENQTQNEENPQNENSHRNDVTADVEVQAALSVDNADFEHHHSTTDSMCSSLPTQAEHIDATINKAEDSIANETVTPIATCSDIPTNEERTSKFAEFDDIDVPPDIGAHITCETVTENIPECHKHQHSIPQKKRKPAIKEIKDCQMKRVYDETIESVLMNRIEKTCDEIIIPAIETSPCSIISMDTTAFGKDIILTDFVKMSIPVTDTCVSQIFPTRDDENTELSNPNEIHDESCNLKDDTSCNESETKEIFFMNSISERDKVLLEIETTPTVPAYLFNGESRDIPTPTPILNSTSGRIPSPSIQVNQIQADSLLCSEKLQVNAESASTSDHEVTSTQEIIDDTAVISLKTASMSPVSLEALPLPNNQIVQLTNFDKSLVVQNNQVDTTNNLPELASNNGKCYSMRKRKLSSSSHLEVKQPHKECPSFNLVKDIPFDNSVVNIPPPVDLDISINANCLTSFLSNDHSSTSKETSPTTTSTTNQSSLEIDKKSIITNGKKHKRHKTETYSSITKDLKKVLVKNSNNSLNQVSSNVFEGLLKDSQHTNIKSSSIIEKNRSRSKKKSSSKKSKEKKNTSDASNIKLVSVEKKMQKHKKSSHSIAPLSHPHSNEFFNLSKIKMLSTVPEPSVTNKKRPQKDFN